ncbi:MAG TPA: hypothetical protein VE077_02510 [Candidatus Methylomirabilis sp.]|nr:hypothetical protein [Candidatus Methylomirabilis sp.]
MNSPSLSSTSTSTRCSHRTASGRQCRLLANDPQSGLCAHHRHIQEEKQAADLTSILLTNYQGFQTAQGVNFTLGSLYKLLAADHISARRAAVLAYISSLLLRSFPAIDADRKAGIIDPTKPVPSKRKRPKSSAKKVNPSGAVPSTPATTNLVAATPTTAKPVASTPTTTAPSANATHPNATQVWSPSNPEPDSTKKPS